MPDLSVLIATYNRAEVLRQTLAAMCALDRERLDVEFVIIDNNSADNTAEVIDSFKDRLPIRHLFQPKQGKSAALNLALETAELGDIVVFTDDDVVPAANWLQEVRVATVRWSEVAVFGGRIDPLFPDDAPSWVRLPVLQFAYSTHAVSDRDMLYNTDDTGIIGEYPCGSNIWVRRRVVQEGFRFQDALGQGHPSGLSGEDGEFVNSIVRSGKKALYCATAVVKHQCKPEVLTKHGVQARIYGMGRACCYRQESLRTTSARSGPLLWAMARSASVVRWGIAASVFCCLGVVHDGFFIKSVSSVWMLGYNLEGLKIAAKRIADVSS